MKFTRNQLFLGTAVAAMLALAFWFGGSAPGLGGWGAAASPTPSASVTQTPETQPAIPASGPETEIVSPRTPAAETAPMPAPTPTEQQVLPSASSVVPAPTQTSPPPPAIAADTSPEAGNGTYLTGPIPEGRPVPVEPQAATVSDTAYTCTLSVRCDSILNHMDWVSEEKRELVPEDGIIFPETVVTFYEGESVFHVLQREMKANGIHMEFENTPIYNSAYIEGIANLYEFDCGELSGWMYQVNGWFPNYGCSRYSLQDGDKVEWHFTCDLGKDVGDTYLGRSE